MDTKETSRSSSKRKLISIGSKPDKSKTKSSGLNRGNNCRLVFSAILTRVLFGLHAAFALWQVSMYYPTTYIYLLCIGLFGLALEMIFTVIIRKGKEYKWFCPSVLCYLMSVVPCLWMLEITRFDVAMILASNNSICNASFQEHNGSAAFIHLLINGRKKRNAEKMDFDTKGYFLERIRREITGNNGTEMINGDEEKAQFDTTTTPDVMVATMRHSPLSTFATNTNSATTKFTSFPLISNIMAKPFITARAVTTDIASNPSEYLSSSTIQDGVSFDNLGQKINEGFSNIKQGTTDILKKTKSVIQNLDQALDLATWILLLHQILLFVLVIGRWLLPKGDITRDQLSQLLLVFIGVGADILEFVTETIDGDDLNETSCEVVLHLVIYAVWSWSLLQFTLVLTASKSRKTRVGFENQNVITTNKDGCCGNSIFSSADLWGILVTLFLQDVPFLATRLYILIVYNLRHQMMIFFTGKNALVVVLQIYRIIVLKMKRDKGNNDDVEESELEPLRGTLKQLAKRAIIPTEAGLGDDIRDATFKKQNDGSVIVKIHVEGEETLRRKRRQASAAKTCSSLRR